MTLRPFSTQFLMYLEGSPAPVDDDGHLFLHDDLRHLVRKGREQHHVHAEGLIGDFADLLDLGAQLLAVGIHAPR